MTPKPSEAELTQLERLEKAATPGPWHVLRERWHDGTTYCDGIEAAVPQVNDLGEPWSERCVIVQTDSGVYPPELPDADLIAAARNALPGLLARIRELEADAEPAKQERVSLYREHCAKLEAAEKRVTELEAKLAGAEAGERRVFEGEPEWDEIHGYALKQSDGWRVPFGHMVNGLKGWLRVIVEVLPDPKEAPK